MNRKTTAALTTACVGVAACTAAYMMADNKDMRSHTKKWRKSTGKALRQVGGFIDDISHMVR